MPKIGATQFVKLRLRGGSGSYLLLPVLTSTQRNALSVSVGYIVYNSTTGQVESYNGSSWGPLLPGNLGNIHQARAYPSANQSLSGTGANKITLDTESYDPGNHFASSRYTADRAGTYVVVAQIGYNSSSTTTTPDTAAIYKNGAEVAAVMAYHNNNTGMVIQVAWVGQLAVNDYIEVYLTQNEGSARNTIAASTWLAVHLLP